MPVIKISGLNMALDSGFIKQAMGFNTTGKGAYLGIYQGKKPTFADVIANADTFRRSDRLWSGMLANPTREPLIYQFTQNGFIVPEKEGIASWFIYAGVELTGKTINAALVGDISSAGGGGDLILDTTELTLKNKYRVRKLKIAFPYSFTY